MITEDYISFETAKLLKEKGFDEICRSYFIENGEDIRYCGAPLKNNSLQESQLLRPTLQMVMKWLRKVHKFHIMIDCIGSKNYIPTIQFTHSSKDIKLEGEKSKIGGNGFDSYEKACEAAIKYCLENLI